MRCLDRKAEQFQSRKEIQTEKLVDREKIEIRTELKEAKDENYQNQKETIFSLK